MLLWHLDILYEKKYSSLSYYTKNTFKNNQSPNYEKQNFKKTYRRLSFRTGKNFFNKTQKLQP